MTAQTQPQSNAKLSGRTLLLARVGWIALVLLMGSAFIGGLPLTYATLSTPCSHLSCLHPAQVAPELAAALDQRLSLSLDTYARIFIGSEIVKGLIFVSITTVILLRRSDDWMALIVSVTLVLFGMIGATLPMTRSDVLPLLRLPINLLQGLGLALLIVMFYLFPNGQFVPRWTRWLTLIVIVFLVGLAPTPLAFGQSYLTVWVAGVGVGLYAQIYRYRRVSGTVERQQSKWVVFGFVVTAIGFLLIILLPNVFFPTTFTPFDAGPMATMADFALFVFALPFWYPLPITLAIAIMRFRLWDVDPIINRALVYSILTALLALIYFSSVVLMQQVFRVEGQAQWVTVISTLAIAALFSPLRRRVQNIIDRRFYRRKYDAAKTLAAFAITVRDETDLDQLTARLIEVVQETMQPAHVSLWLRQATDVSRDPSRSRP